MQFWHKVLLKKKWQIYTLDTSQEPYNVPLKLGRYTGGKFSVLNVEWQVQHFASYSCRKENLCGWLQTVVGNSADVAKLPFFVHWHFGLLWISNNINTAAETRSIYATMEKGYAFSFFVWSHIKPSKPLKASFKETRHLAINTSERQTEKQKWDRLASVAGDSLYNCTLCID